MEMVENTVVDEVKYRVKVVKEDVNEKLEMERRSVIYFSQCTGLIDCMIALWHISTSGCLAP